MRGMIAKSKKKKLKKMGENTKTKKIYKITMERNGVDEKKRMELHVIF